MCACVEFTWFSFLPILPHRHLQGTTEERVFETAAHGHGTGQSEKGSSGQILGRSRVATRRSRVHG